MPPHEDAVVLLCSSDPNKNKAFGSGFIVARDETYSYLLTCAHVIEEINGTTAPQNSLKIPGLEQSVEVIKCGSSSTIDIALLRVAGLFDKPMLNQFILGRELSAVLVTGYSLFNPGTGQHSRRSLNGQLGKSIKLTSEIDGKEIPAWDLVIKDDDFAKLVGGYSGSPLYNEAGQVMAVVSHRRSDEMGHAICISNLGTLYPEVTTLIPGITQLEENSRLANIRTGLLNRMNEIAKIFMKLGKHLSQISQQGIDDEAEIILMMCESFINRDIDAGAFTEFCTSLEAENTASSLQPNYKLLAQRLHEGEIAICIGPELPELSDHGLNSTKELPHKIAALTQFDNHSNALTELCEYAELRADCTRQRVIREIQKLLTPPQNHIPDIALYDLLARIEKPLLIISTGFDTLLKKRLSSSGQRFVSIVSNPGAESEDQRLTLTYSDREETRCSDNKLSSLQLMDNGYSIIYYPRGITEQQDTLLLSERDYFNATDLLKKRYPDYLRNKLKERGLWFLGFSLDSWETRLLANVLQHQRGDNRDRALVIQEDADEFAKLFWNDLQCQYYAGISASDFVAKIGDAL